MEARASVLLGDEGILPHWVDLAANLLTLEQLEETLDRRVVMAVAPTAHAAEQIAVLQETLPVMACKLTALI